MPKVCFLVPASPTSGFFSQVAAFNLALKRLDWKRWQPSMLVCFGEAMTEEGRSAHARWQPYLDDVTIVMAPPIPDNTYFYNQIDGLFRWAPKDADVLVRVDADTLPTGNLEGIFGILSTPI